MNSANIMGNNNRVRSIFTKFVNNVECGISEEDMQQLRGAVAEQLREGLKDVSKDVKDLPAIVESIAEDKIAEALLKMGDIAAKSVEDIQQAILKNFEDIKNDPQKIADELKAEFETLKDKNLEAVENLERLGRDTAKRAEEANGEIIATLKGLKDIAEEFKDSIKLDYTYELSQGWSALRKGRFDKAKEFFGRALQQRSNEADAYFGKYLADCRIQVLWDCVNCRWQPIFHDISADFGDNEFYEAAMKYAQEDRRAEFEEFNEEIKYIMHEFEKLDEDDEVEDYGCFICVKVTDEDGNPTKDSKEAYKIFKRLDKEGYKPFYSEYYLTDTTGKAYEAHILYALYKAKCMIVVCSDKEYLKTPWVKNEYTRYIDMMKAGDKAEDSICIVHGKTKIVRLPNIRHDLQNVPLDTDATFNILNFVGKFVEKDDRDKDPVDKNPHAPISGGGMFGTVEEAVQNIKKEEYERKKEEDERKAEETRKAEEERKAKEEADRKAKEEEKRKAEEARKAEKAKRKAEEERKAKEEADRKAKEEAERKAEEAKKKTGGQESNVKYTRCPACRQDLSFTGEPNAEYQDIKCPSCGVILRVKLSAAREAEAQNKQMEQKKAMPANYPTLENYDKTEFEIDGTTLKRYKGENEQALIPYGVVRIEDNAFEGCTRLTSVTIPSSVKVIGYRVFRGCTGLTSVTIPDGITEIGRNAFRGCTGLTSITIPDSVTRIGDGAFEGCTGLRKIVLPKRFKSIKIRKDLGIGLLTVVKYK